jgi:hypothetical protein
MDACEYDSRRGSGQQPNPGVARIIGDGGSSKCSREHQSFQSDVDDTGALRIKPAERRQHKRRRQVNCRKDQGKSKNVFHDFSGDGGLGIRGW